MTQVSAHRSALEHSPVAWRFPLLGSAIMLALLMVVFWDFLYRQVRWAIEEQADWGHTLVIPFLAGYLAYLNRERLLARPFKTTWVGFVPILLGVGWYTLCSIGPEPLRHHNLMGAGFALSLTGVVLLFGGFRVLLLLAFPLLYLFVFGQTISERFMTIVTFTLQDIAARGSHVALVVLGVDATRDGNTLTVMDDGVPKPLNIAEACSGMRMLMAFFALGVFMAYTGLKRNWQRVLLVLMGVPIALFVNILRVVTLAMLTFVDTNFAAGDFHTFVGLVWLVPAFLLFLGSMWIIRNLVKEPSAEAG